MSSRAAKDWKRRGFAWSSLGEPCRLNKEGCCQNPKITHHRHLEHSPTHAGAARYGIHEDYGGPTGRQARSTSTLKGCSSILAINKTSHCFCSATSKV